MDDKNVEMKSYGVPDDSDQSHQHVSEGTTTRGRRGGTARDEQEMAYFGKEQQLKVRAISLIIGISYRIDGITRSEMATS